MTLRAFIHEKLKSILSVLTLAGTLSLSVQAEEKTDAKQHENLDPVKSQFTYSFNDISDQLVIITCTSPQGQSAGSGFIAHMDGKNYIFTNQHVILGADKISFKTVNGIKLKPRKVELSMTRDIARLEIQGTNALPISTQVKMNSIVAVFGNSEGAGVGTELYGTVNGIGSDLIETSAEFVSGNSGSPVLNLNKEVIGIAAYVRTSRNHIMKKGTKFENKTRRFCYRLNGVEWKTVRWKTYNEKYGKLYRQSEMLSDGIFEIINSWSDSPLSKISISDNPERNLTSWAKSHNQVIQKYNRGTHKKRNILTEYSDSLENLSDVCRGRARQINMFSEQRDLTGFLREQFDSQSSSLDYAAKIIDRCGDTIFSYRDEI